MIQLQTYTAIYPFSPNYFKCQRQMKLVCPFFFETREPHKLLSHNIHTHSQSSTQIINIIYSLSKLKNKDFKSLFFNEKKEGKRGEKEKEEKSDKTRVIIPL